MKTYGIISEVQGVPFGEAWAVREYFDEFVIDHVPTGYRFIGRACREVAEAIATSLAEHCDVMSADPFAVVEQVNASAPHLRRWAIEQDNKTLKTMVKYSDFVDEMEES